MSDKTTWKSRTPTYYAWSNMMKRCYNPKDKSYNIYGGRGITVTAKWHSFDLFLKDMGPKPEGLTLERTDNDGGYNPENCIWASWTIQREHKARTNRKRALTDAERQMLEKLEKAA